MPASLLTQAVWRRPGYTGRARAALQSRCSRVRPLAPAPVALGLAHEARVVLARLAIGAPGGLLLAAQCVDARQQVVTDVLELGRAQQAAGGASRRGVHLAGQRLARRQLDFQLRDL